MNAVTEFMNEFEQLNRRLATLQKVSEAGQKAKDLFRLLCRPDIFQVAYTNVYNNKGAITKGVDDDTLDGMSHDKIQLIVNSLKEDTYRPKPVRRTHIPKKDGNKRPLGIPSGSDKLVQEAIRIILEHIYEPVFSKNSHGFRPDLSCHTALSQIKHTFTSVKWFVEFDIQGFFDNVNHKILISLLEKKIDDKRFIRLLRRFLNAGYVEDWKWHPTYSGMPQGGVISPLLSNIYLHELDAFMSSLIESFNKGKRRPPNTQYNAMTWRINKLRKQIDEEGVTPIKLSEFKMLEKERLQMPPYMENNDTFKRLVYCRYADDFICGVIGSYTEAKNLMLEVELFLQEHLQLNLSPEKTGVQKSIKGIEFLGYGIKAQYSDKIKNVKMYGRYAKRRTISGSIVLTVPQHKVREFCQSHDYGDWQQKKSFHRPKLLYASEAEIIEVFNAELRGLANYYGLARDMKHSLSPLFYLGQGSIFKTLANKRKSSMMKVIQDLRKPNGYSTNVRVKKNGEIINKEVKIFQLKDWKASKVCIDRLPLTMHLYLSGSELYYRMNADECEYCGNSERPLEVHHIRKLKDLKQMHHLEHWQKVMIARHRKTMILCGVTADSCHVLLHQGRLPDKRFSRRKRSASNWRAV
jgi:RNA-directed DNA polymerase